MDITLRDVARQAGVNLSTASRSLNDTYGVHPKTREHVLAIARHLNYRPNRVARGLATGRSHTVGLILSDIRNPFFAELARGAEDAAFAAGCDLVLCNSDLDSAKQMHYVESLLAKQVDGILINSVTRLDHEQEEQLAASGVPVVLLNRDLASRKFSTITGDNAEGGALAARHLRALGHRAIALLTGPRRHGNLSERAKGFRRVLQNGGLPEPTIICGKHTFVGGYEMGKQLLTKHRGHTAVFAANDVIAFGCIRAAIELGVRIPEDISIIGFDDVEICQVVSPPLTTIHMPKYEVGRGAIEMLLKRVADKHLQPEHRLLGVRVVERQSCRNMQP